MKIAFFVSQFPSVSETFIVNQATALIAAGHTVHIFSRYRNPAMALQHKAADEGLLKNTFYLDEITGNRLTKMKQLAVKILSNRVNSNILGLPKTLFTKRVSLSGYEYLHYVDKPVYDVLHAHFGVNGNYVAALKKLGLFKKAVFVTTFHGYDLNAQFAKNDFYTALFTGCKKFTVNSAFSKQKLIRLGCAEKHIHIIPAGLNTGLFKKAILPKKEDSLLHLIFVGRLIKLKGPHLFVEICRLLHANVAARFKATIIGAGEMQEELNQLIEKYKLQEIIKMEGAKSQQEIIGYLNEADLFILPGIPCEGNEEAQGLVIQEAQAMELPVIISDAGGMPEGMIDGQTGFVVKQNDLDGFVKKIELLAGDADLRKKMGAAGRKFVQEKYDSKILNEQLVHLYKS